MSQSPTTEHLLAQFHRTNLSEEDFTEAKKYLMCFEQKLIDSEIIKRALLFAAIVSYARPFLVNESDPKAVRQLPINENQILSEDELEFHNRIISLRNQALAHSQYTRKPVNWSNGSENGFSCRASSFDLLSENTDKEQFLLYCYAES